MTEEKENTELVQTDSLVEVGQMPLLSEKQMADLEKKIIQQKQIKQLVLKTTSARHYLMMGNTPYLNEAGVKIIASFFGLGIKTSQPEESIEKDDEGDYYSFSTLCEVRRPGYESITEIGYADSRDSFFSSVKGGGRKPQSEINKGNIKKKSVTNAMSRAVKACLGLDFTKEEVEKALGQSLGNSNAVDYKSKPKEEMTAGDKQLKEEIKLKIWKMTGKNEEAFKVYLKKLTEWPEKEFAGHDDLEKVSIKSLKHKKKIVDAHYVKWEAEGNV